MPSECNFSQEQPPRRNDRPDRGNTLSGRRGRHAENNEDSDRRETFSDHHGRRAAHSGHSDREDTLSDRRGRDADLRSEQEIGSELGQEEQEPDREVTFSGRRGIPAERNFGQQEIVPRLRDSAPEESAEADNYDRGYDYESPRSQITEEWVETFDLEQEQRCRPGAELDEYLQRTSMTYPAFVLLRDMAEQLQAQKTSASASRQVMVTETPTLLDSKVTFATIKEFEDYLTRHHQQADITTRNAGITTHARQLISPRIPLALLDLNLDLSVTDPSARVLKDRTQSDGDCRRALIARSAALSAHFPFLLKSG